MTMMPNPGGTLWGDQMKRAAKPEPRPAAPAPAVRSDAPETSRQAAKDTAPSSAANRLRILRMMKASKGNPGAVVPERGVTCYEAQQRLDMLPQTASARFTELKRLGFIQATGEKRRTGTGSMAAAWTITEDGLKHLGG